MRLSPRGGAFINSPSRAISKQCNHIYKTKSILDGGKICERIFYTRNLASKIVVNALKTRSPLPDVHIAILKYA